MGMSDLATDPRFANHRARGRHMTAIDMIIAGWTQRFDPAMLLAKLHAAGVPAGRVYEPKDMLEDPHFQCSPTRSTPCRTSGTATSPCRPSSRAFPRRPDRLRWAGQALGADTDAVLGELLGLTDDDVESSAAKA